ncbi:AAA family ATPase [Cohnella candidum]|uniref:ATP-binding protein n=1 Tax=Cohnella candidum TaxID=2674991 RepID=A0A3G3K326_9BACL|nr:AAA family ATPase [Cohnella candidum]AYQ74770.1 ATP-binding protein [Cohnella candidum]
MVSSQKALRSEMARFVGRTSELNLLHQHADGKTAWRWLHLYGPSGIGKSTLLRRFMTERNGRCHYIDGGKVIQQNDIETGELSTQLETDGSFGNPVVLLIDSFDHWHAIEHGFLQWMESLAPGVRIVTFGRSTITGGWLRSEWADSIHAVQLQALTSAEVGRYATDRGIVNSADQAELFRFSRGVPLAMVLAVETLLIGGESGRFAREDKYQLIAALMQGLLQGLPADVGRMLEAASVYWRFNEERLSAVMEKELEPDSFRRFVDLPFVTMKEDGWMLHDAVRAWALEDFILRRPTAYEEMRRNALSQIRKEERLRPQLRDRLQIDKMSLHEHPIVRAISFSGHPAGEIELRRCRQADLPALHDLYLDFHRYSSPTPDDPPPMLHLIPEIWEIDPASFITVWKQNELIAFFGKIPLRGRMLQVAAKEPLLGPFLKAWQPVPNAYLFSIVGMRPELEGNIRGYFLNALINHFSRSEWILDFTCYKEWFPVFELCGFERGEWADAASAKGTEYRAFILDLREEDFIAKLDRSVSRVTAAQSVEEPITKQDIEELKKILKHWSVLRRQPAWAETYARLFPHRLLNGLSDEAAAYAVQQDLKETIGRLADGDETEALYGKLLTHLYLEKIRPHKRVANLLNVSTATYFRYLNKALEMLYQSLNDGKAR